MDNEFKQLKRKSFSLDFKANVIREIESGKRTGDVGRVYSLAHSTVCSIWNSRDKIMRAYNQNSLNLKRLRTPSREDIDLALFEWFKAAKKHKLTVTNHLLKMKANEIASSLKGEDFKCTISWLSRFKGRHDIKLWKVNQDNAIKNSQSTSVEHDVSDNLELELTTDDPESDSELSIKEEPLSDLEEAEDSNAQNVPQPDSVPPYPCAQPRLKIVLPTETRLPDSSSVENQEFLLPVASPQGNNVLAPDHSISEVVIKEECIVPDENEWNPLDPNVTVKTEVSDSPSGPKDSALEEIAHQSSTEASSHQEPLASDSSVFLPKIFTSSETSASKRKSDWPNPPSVRHCSQAYERSDLFVDGSATGQPTDQLECFGNYIVSKLKQMDTRTAILVQKAINDIIFETEIKIFENVSMV